MWINNVWVSITDYERTVVQETNALKRIIALECEKCSGWMRKISGTKDVYLCNNCDNVKRLLVVAPTTKDLI